MYIAAGASTAYGIKNNGTLWVWGINSNGELGVGQGETIKIPTQLGTDTDWKKVETALYSTIFLKTDNTIWVSGHSLHGQNSNVYAPVKVGTDSDWRTISSNYRHAIAVKQDGTLWSWGSNPFGNLGDNTTIDKNNPVQIGNDTWDNVSAGFYHSVGIKNDGTLWTWGSNNFGQLANNSDGSLVPVQIGTNNDWAFVQASGSGNLVIKADGSIWVCGENYDGELGIGSNDDEQSSLFEFNGCAADVLAIHQNTLASITLYPNPTSNTLTLANAENLNIEKLTVIDLSGKTVMTQNGNHTQLDVQQLPVGMYFLTVLANGNIQHLKFIKQ